MIVRRVVRNILEQRRDFVLKILEQRRDFVLKS